MTDHERIWLQPECCACPTDGRLWCQDPDPVDCEEGVPWTEYVRADIADQKVAELVRGLEAIRDYGDSSGRLGIYPEQHEAKYPEFAGDMEESEIADTVLKRFRGES